MSLTMNPADQENQNSTLKEQFRTRGELTLQAIAKLLHMRRWSGESGEAAGTELPHTEPGATDS